MGAEPAYLHGLQAMNAGKPLADIDREEMAQQILGRYEHGELMQDIAHSLGLKGSEQLYRLLIATVPDQWKDYQAARSLRRLEEATVELDMAPDGLTLSRAREKVKAAQWELERLLRRLYGQDQVPAGLVPVQINIGIGRNPGTESVQVVDSVETVADKSSA